MIRLQSCESPCPLTIPISISMTAACNEENPRIALWLEFHFFALSQAAGLQEKSSLDYLH